MSSLNGQLQEVVTFERSGGDMGSKFWVSVYDNFRDICLLPVRLASFKK